VSPIPIGAECSIRATFDRFIAIGGEFEMSSENVLPSFDIELGAAIDAKVRILDPSGAPLVGQPVKLACRHPLAQHSWSPGEPTDPQGEVTFANLNPQLDGDYVAELEFTENYVPTTVPLELNGTTTVFTVEQGKVITGRLLDPQGEPLPGRTVLAHPVNWNPDGTGLLDLYKPIALTDKAGRFHFSNLPSAKMRLQINPGDSTGVSVMPTSAGKAEPVTVRIPR
jgi:hypothetical protein